jgi:hypothetical protein
LYGQPFGYPVDFDGNGNSEVLHLEAREIGWR